MIYVSLDRRSFSAPSQRPPPLRSKIRRCQADLCKAICRRRASCSPVMHEQLRQRWAIAVEMQQIDAAPPRKEDGSHQIGRQGALAIG